MICSNDRGLREWRKREDESQEEITGGISKGLNYAHLN